MILIFKKKICLFYYFMEKPNEKFVGYIKMRLKVIEANET